MKIHTTFRRLIGNGFCDEGIRKLEEVMGPIGEYGLDTPLPLKTVLAVKGLRVTIKSLDAVIPGEKEAAVVIKNRVRGYMEALLEGELQ